MLRPKPQIIENLFSKEDHEKLIQLHSSIKTKEYDSWFSRYLISDSDSPEIRHCFEKSLDIAKKVFNSQTLLPTYALFAHYEGSNAKLTKHKDNNACTYTLDMCVYQKSSWDLWVEDLPYTLYPNDALAYYGEDQEHWREDFPDPKNNYVAMIFFHFAEPDHWYFTKGPGYLSVIRGEISEESWAQNNKM
jgi:hypothetical protein